MDSQNGLPGLLWAVLIAGALATISFTFLFETENPKGQVVMVALFSALVALILLTILLMDFPFTGDITVTSAPFQQILLD
jgi:FtsH-binding integral membrane protein